MRPLVVLPELRRSIEQELRRAGVPGCSIAACARDGRTFEAAFGFADIATRRAATPQTAYHLYSGTKLYTAAALVRLCELEAVTLDDPVSRWIPELSLSHPVTLGQLASHTSGLPDTLRAFLSVHLPGDPTPTTAQALARYRTPGGKHPGVRAQYRNVNFAILGEVITRAAGMPYEDFVRKELLQPLHASVDFTVTPEMVEDCATGHIGRFSPMRFAFRLLFPRVARRIYAKPAGRLLALREFSLDTAAIGGLVGTAPGFTPFLREFLSPGDGVLRADSKRAMLTQRAPGQLGVASRLGVGLAWKHGADGGLEFWNHEGGGPGFTSETRIYPGAGIGVVILMNLTQSAALSRVAHRISQRLARGLA